MAINNNTTQSVMMADGGGGKLSSSFNLDQVENFLKNEEEYAKSLIKRCDGRMQEDFIDIAIATWKSPNAVKFLNSVVTSMKDIIETGIKPLFDSIVDVSMEAAKRWAKGTDGSNNDNIVRINGWTKYKSLSKPKINCNEAKDNDNGDVVLVKSSLNDLCPVLDKIKEECGNILYEAWHYTHYSGFDDKGKEQIKALSDSMEKLKKDIEATFEAIVNALKASLVETVEQAEGVIDANKIDFSTIQTNPEDTLAGNWIPEEYILKEYWTEDDGSKFKVEIREDEGTAVIWKLSPGSEKWEGMGMTTAENGKKLLADSQVATEVDYDFGFKPSEEYGIAKSESNSESANNTSKSETASNKHDPRYDKEEKMSQENWEKSHPDKGTATTPNAAKRTDEIM